MARFRDAKTLLRFAAIPASIHKWFDQQRYPFRRDIFKRMRATVLAAWRQFAF